MPALMQAVKRLRDRSILPTSGSVNIRDLSERFHPVPAGSMRALLLKMNMLAEVADLPESVTLHSGSITSELSIGGFAELFMGRGGDFTFRGHMNNGGVLGIDFLLTLVAMTPSGIAFTTQHSGHTAGAATSGSESDNWTTPGFNERIRDNWPEASQARLFCTLHAEDTLTPQLGKALEEAVQQALQAVAKAAVTALIALV